MSILPPYETQSLLFQRWDGRYNSDLSYYDLLCSGPPMSTTTAAAKQFGRPSAQGMMPYDIGAWLPHVPLHYPTIIPHLRLCASHARLREETEHLH